ncbi:MAG: hypothetical protein V3U54_13025 [Thermodesulfobacteriota bacterium]
MMSAIDRPYDSHISNFTFEKSGLPVTLETMGGKKMSRDAMETLEALALHAFKKSAKIVTIEDLMRISYPQLYGLAKADAPLLTTTTAAFNPIFGAEVWSAVNLEANGFGMTPKMPWGHSGFKIMTTRATTANTGGQAELPTALPDTVKQQWIDISAKPKIVANGFNVSALEQQLGLNGMDDMFTNPLEELRTEAGEEHQKLLNEHFFTDVDTLAGNNMESIDRMITNFSEVTDATISIDAGDGDLWGGSGGTVDRDANNAWSNAHVNHNSGTDRELTPKLINDLFTETGRWTKKNHPRAIITGWDTYRRMGELRAPQMVFDNTKTIQPGFGGIQTPNPGVEGALNVATWDGVPIIVSDDTPKDTISRIYLVNFNYMAIKVLMPTQFYQTGLTTDGNIFALDTFADEGMFVTMLELICKQFPSQAKLRDLK